MINHDNATYISNYYIISTRNPQNCRKIYVDEVPVINLCIWVYFGF